MKVFNIVLNALNNFDITLINELIVFIQSSVYGIIFGIALFLISPLLLYYNEILLYNNSVHSILDKINITTIYDKNNDDKLIHITGKI
jgi:hypothetical protein